MKKNFEKPFLLVIDGNDASGKSVVEEEIKNLYYKNGLYVADLRDFGKHPYHHSTNSFHDEIGYPGENDLEELPVLIIEEPTYTGIGRVIREEIINKKNNYPVITQANMFSADRFILFNNVIIPALNLKKHVVEGRSVTTSLVYQPLLSEMREEKQRVTVDYILSLPGNQTALNYPADIYLILHSKIEDIMKRLDNRKETKNDNSVFDTKEFQSRALKIYLGETPLYDHITLEEFLTEINPKREGVVRKIKPKYVLLSTEGTVEDTKERVRNFFNNYIKPYLEK